VLNQPEIGYSENEATRFLPFDHPWNAALPIIGDDCGTTTATIDKWLGLANPAGGDWSNLGINTSTIGAHLPELPAAEDARPGDDVIYGLDGPLSVQHMAKIALAGHDPLTMSHGWRGEPAYVYVSEGDPTGGAYGPPRYFRVDTTAIGTVVYPPNYSAPIVPGSIASHVAQFRPEGPPPTLRAGMTEPHPWIVFWRLIGRVAGVWPASEPVNPEGMGELTVNMTIRFERQQHLAPDGVVTPRVWLKAGVQ
jgi:hypothetical protein